MKDGIAHPIALMPWITLFHSRFPCCTIFGCPRRSELATTAPVDIMPIICKARLVKVPIILINDTALGLYLLHKSEPALHNLRILAESSLIAMLAIKFNLKLRATFDEGCSPVLANRVTVALS